MKINFFQKKEQPREKRYFEKISTYSNHLGNVLEVVTDRKLAVDDGVYDHVTSSYTSATPDGVVDYYVGDVVSQSDYYPYGMTMAGRNESADDYRYGFNGMEKDNEIKGGDNEYNTPLRQYDPRVGRWVAQDPENQFESPYVGIGNNPIWGSDPNGGWWINSARFNNGKKVENGGKLGMSVSITNANYIRKLTAYSLIPFFGVLPSISKLIAAGRDPSLDAGVGDIMDVVTSFAGPLKAIKGIKNLEKVIEGAADISKYVGESASLIAKVIDNPNLSQIEIEQYVAGKMYSDNLQVNVDGINYTFFSDKASKDETENYYTVGASLLEALDKHYKEANPGMEQSEIDALVTGEVERFYQEKVDEEKGKVMEVLKLLDEKIDVDDVKSALE